MARSSKKKAEASTEDPQADSIDTILDGLEAAVAELDSGELPLEQALQKFEEGIALARRGEIVLRSVEERIETLLADAEGTEPFEAEGEHDD